MACTFSGGPCTAQPSACTARDTVATVINVPLFGGYYFRMVLEGHAQAAAGWQSTIPHASQCGRIGLVCGLVSDCYFSLLTCLSLGCVSSLAVALPRTVLPLLRNVSIPRQQLCTCVIKRQVGRRRDSQAGKAILTDVCSRSSTAWVFPQQPVETACVVLLRPGWVRSCAHSWRTPPPLVVDFEVPLHVKVGSLGQRLRAWLEAVGSHRRSTSRCPAHHHQPGLLLPWELDDAAGSGDVCTCATSTWSTPAPGPSGGSTPPLDCLQCCRANCWRAIIPPPSSGRPGHQSQPHQGRTGHLARRRASTAKHLAKWPHRIH